MKNIGRVVLMTVLLSACGGQKELDQSSFVFVGTVYVIGNEPFTELSIQTDDHRVRLVKKDTTELYRRLWKMQGQKLRIHFRPVETTLDSMHIIPERFELVKD
jgi:hypothetical protein